MASTISFNGSSDAFWNSLYNGVQSDSEISGGPQSNLSSPAISRSRSPSPRPVQNPGAYVTEDNKIFVTKIASPITQQDLVDYFSQFGALQNVHMPAHANAGKGGLMHKGIAFVAFKDACTAQRVLGRSSYEIKTGFHVVVDKSKTRRNLASPSRGGSPY